MLVLINFNGYHGIVEVLVKVRTSTVKNGYRLVMLKIGNPKGKVYSNILFVDNSLFYSLFHSTFSIFLFVSLTYNLFNSVKK